MSDLDITLEQASGIFGNIGHETGGFKYMQEISPAIPGSKGGYGWMQWTGPRRRAFETWCKANNLKPFEDEANYRYLVHETKTEEANSLRLLKLTKTVEAATETFMLKNLRPGIKHLNSRYRWARLACDTVKSMPKRELETKQTNNLPFFVRWIVQLINWLTKGNK